MLTEEDIQAIKPVRYARKVWDGRGLYLLVTPKGSLCWRYAYRFAGKYKNLSLGTYPVITIAWARLRHEFARNLLADGVDPAVLKASIGKQAFASKMRDWDTAGDHLSALAPEIAEAIKVLHCESAR